MLPVDVFKVLNAIGEQKTVSSLPSVFQEHSHCPRSFWTSYAVFCSGIPQDKKPGLLIYAASHYVCWMAVALHFQMTLGLTQTASYTEALGGWLLTLLSSFSGTRHWPAAPLPVTCHIVTELARPMALPQEFEDWKRSRNLRNLCFYAWLDW